MVDPTPLHKTELEASLHEAVLRSGAKNLRLREALIKIAEAEGEDDPAIMWPWAQEVARAALSE